MTDPSNDGMELAHPARLEDVADEENVVMDVKVVVPPVKELLAVTEEAEALEMVEVG